MKNADNKTNIAATEEIIIIDDKTIKLGAAIEMRMSIIYNFQYKEEKL